MKRICSFCLALLILFSVGTVVLAEENVTVFIGKEKVEFTDAAPTIINGRTMVPMRSIFQELGATVKWDEEAGRVESLFQDGTHISLYIDKKIAYKNGELVILETEPFLKEDRTFIPLRFVAESSGATVLWDEKTSSVNIVPKWLMSDFIPFGEFMSIPSPASVNENFKYIDYKKDGNGAVITYSMDNVTVEDIAKYEDNLTLRGYNLISGAPLDNEKILYDGNYVIKTKLANENDVSVYIITLYSDKEGTTIKDYLK